MPPRTVPKIFQLLVKTHQLTIFLAVPHERTIASLKDDVLSALSSEVNQAEGVPKVMSVSDFELCRGIKERGRSGVVSYEKLADTDTVKATLSNWDNLFVQFRDDSGKLAPVEVSLPSLLGEDDEESQQPTPQPVPARATEGTVDKGKRKERSD